MALASKKRKKRKKPSAKRCAPVKHKAKAKKPNRNAHSSDLEAVAAKKKRRKKVKCRPVKKKKKVHRKPATPKPPVVSAPVPPIPPPPPPPSAPPAPVLPVYKGTFGRDQAARLLFRAGFGPRRGEAEKYAAMGMQKAVLTLTRPVGAPVLDGPAPLDKNGNPWNIDPVNVYEMDALYWFDRMLRTNQPMVERLALIFHDWFATSELGIAQKFMLDQTNLFRKHGLGSFKDLVHDISKDPAMILWLSLNKSVVNHPNENYARELMELFTLGAGRGYTEQDIREAARALTGWTSNGNQEDGSLTGFDMVPSKHDSGQKTVFGKKGNWGWEDIARMVIEHPMHPSYFVTKLWSYFIPTPPSATDADLLAKLYKSTGYQIRPVLEAILMHPALYTGATMVKPPVVWITGLLHARNKFINGDLYTRSAELAGQRLYQPPDVGGWDDTRWLDSNTMSARWLVVYQLMVNYVIVDSAAYPASETPEEAVDSALAFWDRPTLRKATTDSLLEFARTSVTKTPDAASRAMRQNALRHLIAVSPDYQVT